MLIHVRPGQTRPGQSPQIPAMILVRNGRAEKVDTRSGPSAAAACISWHPSGKLLAFSRNRIVQAFHTAGPETREVVDKDSDLGFYLVDTGQVYTVPQVSRPDRLETFPSWSPDGRYLYFCSAPLLWTDKEPPLQYDKIRYDLERIAYDPLPAGGARWRPGRSARVGKSISLPRISPDGRFLMFAATTTAAFPFFNPAATCTWWT